MATLFTNQPQLHIKGTAFGQLRGWAVFGHEQKDHCFGKQELDPIIRDLS